jgi:hypothetical protein
MTPEARRRAILRRFVDVWGEPELTHTIARGDDTVDAYGFPARQNRRVFRVVTVGAAQVRRDDGEQAGFELLMVLPGDLGGATFNEVSSFMFDVFAYGLTSTAPLRVGGSIAPSPLVPQAWPTRALLFDEPAGEPEDLATFHVDGLHVDLLWVVPIYPGEYERIRQDGLDWFYDRERESEWSLADPHRPPFDEGAPAAT